MNKTIETFIEELKKKQDVLGVLLFGSWARGNNRSESDVDLLVIIENGFKRTVEELEGQMFEIIYTTPKAALEYWKQDKDGCAGVWEVAKILYDKDGTISKLQKDAEEMLAKGKPIIDDHARKQLHFDKEDKIKFASDTVDDDVVTASLVLHNAVSELTKVFFDLQQMWAPAPKQRLAKIKELNPIFYELLVTFYDTNTNIQIKLGVAQKMVQEVFK